MTIDELKEFQKEYNEWLDDLEREQNKLEESIQEECNCPSDCLLLDKYPECKDNCNYDQQMAELEKEYDKYLDELAATIKRGLVKEAIEQQENKPTYDDLIFLISFLWKWSDDPKVLEALVEESAFEEVMNDELYRKWLKEEDLERASQIFWDLKDDIVKINGFWE